MHFIAVVMGIILNIIGNFLKHFSKSIIGKKLSIIGWGLVTTILTVLTIASCYIHCVIATEHVFENILIIFCDFLHGEVTYMSH